MSKIEGDFFTIEAAWWKWVDDNCPSQSKRARGRWMSENVFEYEGTTWTRSYVSYKSNSGKSVVDSTTVFAGADGRKIYKTAGSPNRRNDADRNWGLGRE
jgi:hypothetical protein